MPGPISRIGIFDFTSGEERSAGNRARSNGEQTPPRRGWRAEWSWRPAVRRRRLSAQEEANQRQCQPSADAGGTFGPSGIFPDHVAHQTTFPPMSTPRWQFLSRRFAPALRPCLRFKRGATLERPPPCAMPENGKNAKNANDAGPSRPSFPRFPESLSLNLAPRAITKPFSPLKKPKSSMT